VAQVKRSRSRHEDPAGAPSADVVAPSEPDAAVALSPPATVGCIELSLAEATFELPPSGLEVRVSEPEVAPGLEEPKVMPPSGADPPLGAVGPGPLTRCSRGARDTGVTPTGRGAGDGAALAAGGGTTRTTRTTGAASVGRDAGAR
jgi:hypothetical protein